MARTSMAGGGLRTHVAVSEQPIPHDLLAAPIIEKVNVLNDNFWRKQFYVKQINKKAIKL